MLNHDTWMEEEERRSQELVNWLDTAWLPCPSLCWCLPHMQGHRDRPYHGHGLTPMAVSPAVAFHNPWGSLHSPLSTHNSVSTPNPNNGQGFKCPNPHQNNVLNTDWSIPMEGDENAPAHYLRWCYFLVRHEWPPFSLYKAIARGHTSAVVVARFLQLRHQGTGVTRVQKSSSSATYHHYWMNRLATHFC